MINFIIFVACLLFVRFYSHQSYSNLARSVMSDHSHFIAGELEPQVEVQQRVLYHTAIKFEFRTVMCQCLCSYTLLLLEVGFLYNDGTEAATESQIYFFFYDSVVFVVYKCHIFFIHLLVDMLCKINQTHMIEYQMVSLI